MTEHIELKHKVKSIGSKVTFNEILEESMLNDNEKELMKLYYEQNKPMDYIADVMGYSLQGVIKMHKRALKKIELLL